MANFTPQEIEQMLQEFFDTVGKRQYVGARYVPVFGRHNSGNIDWDNRDAYEPLTIVYYNGDTYTSRRYVPAGIDISDTDYWVITGRYNAQVEQYRQEVLSFQWQIDAANEAVNTLREDVAADYVPFPDTQQYPKYGTSGQLLSTHANGHTEWVDPVTVTSEVAEPLIEDWLDAHPEATTTVLDGSVTDAKLVQSGGILSRVGVRDILPRPSDFNDFVNNAAYIVRDEINSNNYTNKPNITIKSGFLTVYRISTWIVQIYYNLNNDVDDIMIFYRLGSYNSSTETYSFHTWTCANYSKGEDTTITDFNSGCANKTFWITRSRYNSISNAPSRAMLMGSNGTHCVFSDISPTTSLSLQTLMCPQTGVFYFRMYTGTWSDWTQILQNSRLMSYETDLNNINYNSTWILRAAYDGRYINIPDDFRPDAGFLECWYNSSNGWVFQRLTSTSSEGAVWYRMYTDGNAGNWTKANASIETAISTMQEDITELQDQSLTDESLLKLNLPAIFHTIGVVGDSLASGQGRINNMSTYHDFYDFSWPQCMAKEIGSTVYNFTKSGLNTRTWLTNQTYGWSLANDGNHRSDCYIIGLGANDVALGSEYVGSSSDINIADYTQNADTYYGNYARIISMLRTVEPRSYIFVLTNPVYGSDATVRAALNDAVRYMPTIFNRVYLIDFDTDEFTGNSFIARNNVHSHYTPAAYKYIANLITKEMSKIIYNNPSEFYWANLVGTQYSDPS